MNQMNRMKQIYQEQEIPAALSDIVRKTIQSTGEMIKMRKRKQKIKQISGIAAAIVVVVGGFGITINTNEAFAATVKDIPILGSIAKLFTGYESHTQTDIAAIDIRLPQLNGMEDEAFQAQLNQQITDKMMAIADQAEREATENRNAWLGAGNKASDFMPIEIIIDYRLLRITKDTLSFEVYKTETSASYYEESYLYNIDLKNNQELTLKELLGEDYISIANAVITSEIAEREAEEGTLFFKGEEGFQTIKEDQAFYVNEDGIVVIRFNKYEIAPGYMGVQEFEIK